MSDRRMFSNAVIDTDTFLDMPLTTQALYFHLGMKADDDGFVGSPKKIVRAVNCTEDDFKLLVSKGFVLCFENGVIVITHWNINNTMRKDRRKATIYTDEKARLTTQANDTYAIYQSDVNLLSTNCQPNDNQLSAQSKLNKNKLNKSNISSSATADTRAHFDYQSVIDLFNSICKSLPKVQKITDKRRKAIKNAHKLLGGMSFDELFAKVENSDFLTGRTGKWSGCGFDWILTPSNLTKIIEGNYDNKNAETTPNAVKRNYDEVF